MVEAEKFKGKIDDSANLLFFLAEEAAAALFTAKDGRRLRI